MMDRLPFDIKELEVYLESIFDMNERKFDSWFGHKVYLSGTGIFCSLNSDTEEILERETLGGIRLAIEAYWVDYAE